MPGIFIDVRVDASGATIESEHRRSRDQAR